MKSRILLRGLSVTLLALSALLAVTASMETHTASRAKLALARVATHLATPVTRHRALFVRALRQQRTTWDSVYTDEQATRGQAAYNRTCARCHLESLAGADESPALTGAAFLSNWNGLTLGEMHARVKKSMPTDDPGTYGPQLITDVMAYVLRANGFPAGKAELTHEGGALDGVQFSAARP